MTTVLLNMYYFLSLKHITMCSAHA